MFKSLYSKMIFGCCFSLFAIGEHADAQTQDLDLSNRSHLNQCVESIHQAGYGLEDLNDISPSSLRSDWSKCNFKQLYYHSKIREGLGGIKDKRITKSQAESLLKFRNEMLAAAKEIQLKSRGKFSNKIDYYFSDAINYIPQISFKTLNSGGNLYLPQIDQVKNKFKFEVSEGGVADNEYNYDSGWNCNGSEKDLCLSFAKAYVFATIFYEVWAENALKSDDVAIDSLDKLKSRREDYFFNVGDGLYFWELGFNELIHGDQDILNPPDTKLNLLHPAPVLNYDNSTGDFEPGLIVELVGFTKIDYDNSMHWGAAIAGDFSQDNLRFGGAIHLPIKGALKNLRLEGASNLLPCEVCSVTFLTDGDDDWSIGLKVNVASLLAGGPDKIGEALLQDVFE